MTQADGTWFHKPGASSAAGTTAAGPDLRLVCFVHAGGVPSFFNGWPGHLPQGIELLAACYPGRQDRFGEPYAETLEELASQAVDALAPYLDVPLAFFGHSMGAAVAYEAARQLDARHSVQPVRLFLSGHPAPHRRQDTKGSVLHREDDTTLLAEVRRLGLSSSEVMEHPELLEIALPTLRADFRLVETYTPPPAKVRSPVVAYAGDQDTDCPPETMRAWSELTTAAFEFRAFPGGHFYLETREAQLLRHITGHLWDDIRLARVVRVAPGARTGSAR